VASNRDSWLAEPDLGDAHAFVDLDGTVRCVWCKLDSQGGGCSCCLGGERAAFRRPFCGFCEINHPGRPVRDQGAGCCAGGGGGRGWTPAAQRHWRAAMPLHLICWNRHRIEARGADGIIVWTRPPGGGLWRLGLSSAWGPNTPPMPPPWLLARAAEQANTPRGQRLVPAGPR